MNNGMFAPRVISNGYLDDAALGAGIGFEFRSAAPGSPSPRTCNYGFTKMCDSDGLGHTCTYGWTFKCDSRQTPGRR
jgi:hypothetical protein